MTVKKIVSIDKGTMKRSLRLMDVFSVGYADLGSSIYYALGITALYALGATPVALMIAGFVFFLTAMTYAEMSSVVPESGGSASFSRRAFNDLISFFAGWALLLDYIVTIAISAFAVGPYLKYFFPVFTVSNESNIILTVGIILFLLVLNILGTKHSTRMNIYLSVGTIITQFLIIIFGLLTIVNFSEFFKSLSIGTGALNSPSWTQFGKGVAMAMVAYTGIESMAQLGAETQNPSHSIPKAMKYVVVVLIASYLGLSIVALSAVSPQVLSTTFLADPISGIATKLPYIGSWLANWVGLLGAVILFSASNSGLLGASRVSYNLGEYCQLPKIFHQVHPRLKTPVVALVFFAIFASFIVIWSGGNLGFMADLYNFGAQLAFLSAHLSLIVHRVQYPDMHRPFKLKFNLNIKGKQIPISAIIGAILNLSVWISVIITKKEGRELGMVWLFIGFLFYFFLRRSYKIGITEQVEVKKVQIENFEKMSLSKILVPIRQGYEEENMKIACQIAKDTKSSITVLHISEIPWALPLHNFQSRRAKSIEHLLEKAEAIAKEYHLTVELKQINSRSIAQSIIDVAKDGHFDLIVLGFSLKDILRPFFQDISTEVLKRAPCRVWICKKEHK